MSAHSIPCNKIVINLHTSMGTSLVYCGNAGPQHKPKQCPAFGQECILCHKLNHFFSCSRQTQLVRTWGNSTANQKVHDIERYSFKLPCRSQDLFIDPLEANGLKKSMAWFANLYTNGGQLCVKLDTGAEVSVSLNADNIPNKH